MRRFVSQRVDHRLPGLSFPAVQRTESGGHQCRQRADQQFEAQVNQLTAQINSLDPSTDGNQITNLIDQRSTISNQITNLQQTVQQDNLATLSVTNGSQVLTSGTAGHLSKAKVFLLDGMSGLIAGLALGMLYVILAAILSDRLRRRERRPYSVSRSSSASVVSGSIFSGAHLPSSLRRLSHFLHLGWLFGQNVSDLVEEPSTDVLAVAQLLRDQLELGRPGRPNWWLPSTTPWARPSP